jgi:threonine-phosphate decarboxylase
VESILHYPEPDAGKLQRKLSSHHSVSENNIIVTNGSTEAFYMIAHRFAGEQSFILTPSFAEYEDACRTYKHDIVYVSNDLFEHDLTIKKGLVWIGNPNNPDGRCFSTVALEGFCDKNRELTVVVDEAYGELCEGVSTFIPLIRDHHNLVIVRSLTKTFAIPGLRLGYMLMNSVLQEEIMKCKIPWSVNSLALEAGSFIINNYNAIKPDLLNLVERSVRFQDQLDQIEGIGVIRSKCNYFLIRLLRGSAPELKRFLIQRHKVLIRDASNFQGLDKSYIRVALQEESHNQLLIEGISSWLKTI